MKKVLLGLLNWIEHKVDFVVQEFLCPHEDIYRTPEKTSYCPHCGKEWK